MFEDERIHVRNVDYDEEEDQIEEDLSPNDKINDDKESIVRGIFELDMVEEEFDDSRFVSELDWKPERSRWVSKPPE